jgi:hypothetical protein
MKKLGAITIIGIVWSAISLSLTAQSGVTITAPASGVKLPAGPDYATDVLGDPWDMNNAEDISPYPDETSRAGWGSDFAVSGGRVGGTTVLNSKGKKDTSLAFLNRGFYDVVNTGRTGLRYPISSSFYKVVSFKMNSGAADEYPQAYWFHYPRGGANGTEYGVRFLPKTVVGNQIVVADLTQALEAGSAWTAGSVKGFRLDPNGTKVGHKVYFDWVRLTRSDSETTAKQRISWSGGSGSTTIDVIDAAGTAFRVASGLTGTFYDWNYGVLPPGAYTLRITRGSQVATRPFSINNPPLLTVTDPDETGGQDYATQVLGNPWDMDNGANDVKLTADVTAISYSGGQFHGTNTNADPVLFVLNNSNNTTPIDTQKYRYLTYSLKVDGTFSLHATDGGSVARVMWSSTTGGPNGFNTTTTEDIIVWPGMNSYTVDLGSLQFGEDKGLESLGSMKLWMAEAVRHFRLDPHEFDGPHPFHLDNIKLAAMDESSGSFTIRFAGSDADGDAATVSLYYDTNTNPNDGKTLIASGVALSAGQFTWNTGNVAPGTYWVYALASDALDARGAYSTGKIRVNSGGGSTNGDPLTVIEQPTNGATVNPSFTLSGWAIDRDAPSGSGVDYVQVYRRVSGGSNVFLGNATRTNRTDIASTYGSQFLNSGYTMNIASLAPGTYTMTVMAHSTVTNTFDTKTVNVTVPAQATTSVQMALESPANNSSKGSTFTVSGWAVDIGAPTGTGVDMVAVYHMPAAGGATTYHGLASYGAARSDIGSLYGSRFTNSGFSKSLTLPAGSWRVIVYAKSTVTGKWHSRSAVVNVVSALSAPASNVQIAISSPSANAQVGNTFTISGSAVDLGAPSGTGVDRVAIYRMPAGGGTATLIGLASYGQLRTEIASQFGSQFANSGFSMSISLPDGAYTMVVFARSTVTGDWKSKTVTVSVH